MLDTCVQSGMAERGVTATSRRSWKRQKRVDYALSHDQMFYFSDILRFTFWLIHSLGQSLDRDVRTCYPPKQLRLKRMAWLRTTGLHCHSRSSQNPWSRTRT